MKSRKKGFSLIELLVVLAIFFILLYLGYAKFNSWRKAMSIEDDVQKIYSEIQKARMKAFTTKTEITITIENGTLKENDVEVMKLENPFKIDNDSSQIVVNEKGLFSKTGSIKYDGTPPPNIKYGCIEVSRYRIRKLRWCEE
jgi:prepilin-type N-terminal cleavage/methylation domain-containing protein